MRIRPHQPDRIAGGISLPQIPAYNISFLLSYRQ